MNTDEEALQQKIELGEFRAEEGESDVLAYREVFRALGKAPDYTLSPDFAARVVARVSAPKHYAGDFLWYAGGLLFVVLGFWVAMWYSGISLDTSFLRMLADYKEFIVFSALFVGALHVLDRKLFGRLMQHG